MMSESESSRGLPTARRTGRASAKSDATASSPIIRPRRWGGEGKTRACYTFGLPIQQHGRADMKTWEYKIINVRSENYSMDPRRAEELNRLGDEGWELVSITSINFKTGATDHIGMVFKREKQQSPA